jgi:hypothetical protein
MPIIFGSYRSLNFFLALDLAVRKVDDHSDYSACRSLTNVIRVGSHGTKKGASLTNCVEPNYHKRGR